MISPQAYIAPGAKIGERVKIYPFAYIEDDVVVGDNCTIYPHVSLMNGTRIGQGNTIYQNAVLGACHPGECRHQPSISQGHLHPDRQ